MVVLSGSVRGLLVYRRLLGEENAREAGAVENRECKQLGGISDAVGLLKLRMVN